MTTFKGQMTKLVILVFKGSMRLIYAVLKLFPVNRDKVVFCSRQSDDIPLDFCMLRDELAMMRPGTKCVFICHHIEDNFGSYMVFLKETLRSMYHMATGSVCVIDSYWPAVSLLKHKDSLKVIQIWHSIGKVKKSGYQTLGKISGRKEQFAAMLGMHKNYDYIIAGAKAWNRFYCESFNTDESRLRNYGLPRIDHILDTEQENRERFFAEHPDCRGKKIILYAPTFRKNMESRWHDITALSGDNRILIIKGHPQWSREQFESVPGIYRADDWEAIDLLAVCDVLVTDYSAIALEAAVLNRKTYYWTYDYDRYMVNNGLNIDLHRELGPHVFEDIKELKKAIDEDRYDDALYQKYRERYILPVCGGSTKKITELIVRCMQG